MIEKEFDMPPAAKWIAAFINRIGFPIFAFCIMTYMCFVSLRDMSKNIQTNTSVIASLQATIDINNMVLNRASRHMKNDVYKGEN